MKNNPEQDPNSKKKQNLPKPDDQTRSEIDSLVQNALKKRGDTAVHIAVTNNNPVQLRQLLDRGLRVFNQSEADGGTPLHRAAEIGSQECAKILLEFNADIDALNFEGQTAFHVAAEKQDYEFGKYLIKFRARKNCRSGCKKCRFFIKQIERYDKTKKEAEEQAKQARLEESKKQTQEVQDQKLVDDISQLNLLDEIEKCRKEMGGPFFNKKENQILKEKQAKYRAEETIRTQRSNKPAAAIPDHHEQVVVSLETPVVVEKIRPRRPQQQQTIRVAKTNESPRDDMFPETTRQDRIRQQQPQQPQSQQQSARDMIRPRQSNLSSYQSTQEGLMMNNKQQPNNQNNLLLGTNVGQAGYGVVKPAAMGRQKAKKQKRKERIEELEEEKKAGKSPTNQTNDVDSDHY